MQAKSYVDLVRSIRHCSRRLSLTADGYEPGHENNKRQPSISTELAIFHQIHSWVNTRTNTGGRGRGGGREGVIHGGGKRRRAAAGIRPHLHDFLEMKRVLLGAAYPRQRRRQGFPSQSGVVKKREREFRDAGRGEVKIRLRGITGTWFIPRKREKKVFSSWLPVCMGPKL